jgi:hypothetical protein
MVGRRQGDGCVACARNRFEEECKKQKSPGMPGGEAREHINDTYPLFVQAIPLLRQSTSHASTRSDSD